ncbi:hypothetical protein J0A68_02195 [Algoriphagus sp. H41]|uniref:Uncharacterized protein n=1 Tax=Algoriphagus oliviformis TaxID=2811231 RepID=A0ABS3BY28_9BACT|nr:hypothetical protein [Algoriphagus oliviformis]MBN7809750.1 hypothetical protein [Algoriphagus oliviformis]
MKCQAWFFKELHQSGEIRREKQPDARGVHDFRDVGGQDKKIPAKKIGLAMLAKRLQMPISIFN